MNDDTNGWILIDQGEIVELGASPEAVLNRIQALLFNGRLSSPNAVVDIGSPGDACVAVGVTGQKAYVEFGTKDGDPPYYRIVDPTEATSDAQLVFLYKGERTPLPAKNCIAVDDLMPVLEHFIRTESLPQWIMLEEV